MRGRAISLSALIIARIQTDGQTDTSAQDSARSLYEASSRRRLRDVSYSANDIQKDDSYTGRRREECCIGVVVVVVVTFFNHNLVNCKATLILAIKIYEIKYNSDLNDIHT